MRNPNNRPIDDLVFDCCRDLFSAYQLDVHPRDRSDFPATEKLAVCGVMGFGGKSLRGALVLALTYRATLVNQHRRRVWNVFMKEFSLKTSTNATACMSLVFRSIKC